MQNTKRLVLASTSPRRKEILALLGLPYEITRPDFDEHLTALHSAKEDAISFALGKAQSVKNKFPNSVIIGSDTLIEDAEGKLGKPSNHDHAKQILHRLKGGRHQIWTAVALIDTRDDATYVTVEQIEVQMRKFVQEEVDRYVETGEALDKAGAYSLQGEGRRFIESLKGDYLAAVGLPLRPVAAFLRQRKICIPLDIERLYHEKNFLNWKEFS